jgi:hypothetical protein
MANPSDVGTDELYTYPEPPNPLGGFLGRLINALKAPDEAEGWPRIIIPAIITGLAVSAVRRVLM